MVLTSLKIAYICVHIHVNLCLVFTYSAAIMALMTGVHKHTSDIFYCTWRVFCCHIPRSFILPPYLLLLLLLLLAAASVVQLEQKACSYLWLKNVVQSMAVWV